MTREGSLNPVLDVRDVAFAPVACSSLHSL